MKKISILTFVCLLSIITASGQVFNKSINKDSLVKAILKDLPENKKVEFLEAYNSSDVRSKEFLLFMFSMPKSSRKELIKNIDSNYENVDALKTQYNKLVPPNYTVSIEFNPENKIVSTKETIDLKIALLKNNMTTVTQEWNLELNSEKLNQMLVMLNWNNETLITIKKLLANANCISIENGQKANIGFARSGMGKYSYLLFSDDLTAAQIKHYNNGCEYIFYKKRIVLQYGGGAVGPQCFPD
ncbi:hypothetical protein IDJ77_18765 [Mucilaginibacter sp. ZT4R22]|uniref:Uncharacterized protein n=1 Tax=Mucilaginibacter pankratovii TaxID=2772110 RepID=A0ABR7WU84_9SPHI|nr:hypothetical protein [Mucilaginibacter pankratovii]MBD1365865.1 hypothetical protein [Mucilaginibacter pankratovii]